MSFTWYVVRDRKVSKDRTFQLKCHYPDFTHCVFDADVKCTAEDGNVQFTAVRRSQWDNFIMGEDATMAALLMWWGNEQYAGLRADVFLNKLGVQPVQLG